MMALKNDDATRALILRAALETYSEQQYRLARDARNTRKMRDIFATRMDRVRYAQGCDARRRMANEMIKEMDSDA